MKRFTFGMALLACACLGAQVIPEDGEKNSSEGWKVRLGARLFTGPQYPGSGQQRVAPLPVFSAIYADKFFIGTTKVTPGLGVGMHALKSEHWTWDLGVGLGEGRREKKTDVLAGMGDRDPSVFAGMGLMFHSGGFQSRLLLVEGANDQAGREGTFSIGYTARLMGNWVGHATLSTAWSDSQNMAFWFGVTPEQAAQRAALLVAGDARLQVGEDRAYAPKAGLREVALNLGLTYRVDDHWRWFGMAHLQQLQGEARQSPLVRRDTDASLGVGFAYQF